MSKGPCLLDELSRGMGSGHPEAFGPLACNTKVKIFQVGARAQGAVNLCR